MTGNDVQAAETVTGLDLDKIYEQAPFHLISLVPPVPPLLSRTLPAATRVHKVLEKQGKERVSNTKMLQRRWQAALPANLQRRRLITISGLPAVCLSLLYWRDI